MCMQFFFIIANKEVHIKQLQITNDNMLFKTFIFIDLFYKVKSFFKIGNLCKVFEYVWYDTLCRSLCEKGISPFFFDIFSLLVRED